MIAYLAPQYPRPSNELHYKPAGAARMRCWIVRQLEVLLIAAGGIQCELMQVVSFLHLD